MNQNTMNTKLKHQGYRFWLPLAAAIALCGLLTFGGIISYLQVIAGAQQSFNDVAYTQVRLSRLAASIAYVIICAVYLIWLLQPWQDSHQRGDAPFFSRQSTRFSALLRPAIPFLLLAWLAFPLSNDIYLYLQYGLIKLLGSNPYITPAGEVTTVLSPLLDWYQTATYGPISLMLFVASALGVSIHPILGVYLFKFFCVLIYILNAYLVWLFLRNAPARNKLTIAYLFNPYLMIAQVADAHIDVLLSTSIILLVGWLYQRRYIAAVLILVAGIFTKTLPIIWLPLVINFLIRRQQWQKLAVSAVACLMIGIAMSRTILPTWTAWQSLLNPGTSGKTARSLHHLVTLALTHLGGIEWDTAKAMAAPLATFTFLGFGLFYVWTLLKPYRQKFYSEANLVQDIGWVTLVLILFATPWIMPWYASVLLSIAVLATDAPLFCIVSLTFGLCSGVIFGAGSGDSFLSMFAAILTVCPAIAILIFRDRVLQFCRPAIDRLLLGEQDQTSVSPEVPATSAR
jgi:alpha-1,6-mannosyltransferase